MKNIISYMMMYILALIPLCATDYYVSPNGSATFTTIQEAVDTAHSGDTVYIKAGTYHERISFNHSGTATHPIVVKNFEQDKVIIDGTNINWSVSWGGLLDFSEVSYINLSGLTVLNSTHAGIFLDDCHHITIKNSKTHNTYSSGIGVWYSHNVDVEKNEVSLACNDGGEECISIVDSYRVVVEYNEVHHNGPGSDGGEGIDVKQGSHDVLVAHNEVHHLNNRIGLYTDPWDTHTYNIVFDGNSVHDCTNFGMAIASEMGGLIEHVIFMNNLIYNNLDGGMAVGGWTAEGQTVASNPIHHINIINNTIYNNINSDGLYIANPDVIDIKVHNNIIGKNDDSQIYIENTPLSEVSLNANLVEGITGQYGEVNQIIANPMFIDVSKGDFHLKPNSPAIDSGVSNSIVLDDFDGIKRSQNAAWDIGAYEYQSINIEQFVTRFYDVILGRSPDSAGLSDWSSKLEGLSKSGADIAKGFIFSVEYNIDAKTDDQYLTTLYSAFFDRAGDTGGLAYWHEQIALGVNRAEVLDGFLNSTEFKNLADIYGIIANATPVELFVSRFYKQTLERSPDAAGLADWSGRLNSGAASGSDVAFGFVFSGEFTARNLNNTEYLSVLYKAFFAREPDTAGFNSWKTQLDAGVSREDVLQGFLGAPEFANLASEYGIRVN